jgi:hypothetical protein
MSETGCWIGLSLVPDVGPVMSQRLLAEMGSRENISRAGMKELLAVRGLGKQKAEKIKNFRLWDFVEKQLTLVEKKGIRVVVYRDEEYPQVLKETEGAPIVSYMKGEYHHDDRYGIVVAVSPSACSSSRRRSTAAHPSPRIMHSSRTRRSLRCRATSPPELGRHEQSHKTGREAGDRNEGHCRGTCAAPPGIYKDEALQGGCLFQWTKRGYASPFRAKRGTLISFPGRRICLSARFLTFSSPLS